MQPSLLRATSMIALASLFTLSATAQQSSLTVQQIMQDQAQWIGGWPSGASWSEDGQWLYFNWNPKGAFESDSLFRVSRSGGEPEQVSIEERRGLMPRFFGWQHGTHTYDATFERKVFSQEGDLYLLDRSSGEAKRLTYTNNNESSPRFSLDGDAIIYSESNNFFRMDLEDGTITQITDLRSGSERPDPNKDGQDTFLEEQQTELFRVIRERQRQQKFREEARERENEAAEGPPVHFYGNKRLFGAELDPTERFVAYHLTEQGSRDDDKVTMGMDFVTESGYAEEIRGRTKVGESGTPSTLHIFDLVRDTTIQVDLHQLPGAYDVPAYRREMGVEVDSTKTKRDLSASSPTWSGDGAYAVVEVTASDYKDRWIARLDPMTGDLTLLDRQHDDAWIGGPGTSSFSSGFLPDGHTYYFQSEKTGFSHLYSVDVRTGATRQLTDGEFEVFGPQLSRDGQTWFFTSSEGSPFERHFYRMDVNGGRRTRLTTMTGNNDVALNPDESVMGIVRSFTNRPPEVYLQTPGRDPEQITSSPTDEWLAYDWRSPDIIHFEASDGVMVPAQLFVPTESNGAAVIFVHGAGYLQNVHRWWSSYSREYMFNNLLTDLGYTVMNVDYRASSGYGRDWRTAIYRYMGGRDLQDQVDASMYLGREFGIDPERIGMYGGSYGGFITLMALFTEPEHFGAGAALRSVTDWAHYNHGYTARILNTPVEDSLAYRRSSPIYFAEGLEDPLLMPHGLIDMNVQFQDIIRLTQRLIELGKEDWELAVYPVEGHGFTEADSWTDEYRRILKLFEETVGRRN